jgi:glycosyltransferase involved in cell wall biosynthesis/peptidoglycan/xylan/chitin deacetylase (PgdA/CDA1 family)
MLAHLNVFARLTELLPPRPLAVALLIRDVTPRDSKGFHGERQLRLLRMYVRPMTDLNSVIPPAVRCSPGSPGTKDCVTGGWPTAAVTEQVTVAHLVLTLNTGGLERLVCDLARQRSSEFQTIVCCLDARGHLADSLEASGIKVHVVSRHGGLDAGLIVRLARWLRRQGVQVLHTHGPDPMFYGGWAAKLAGVAVRVHTQHDTMLADGSWRDRLKFRLAAPAFHSVVAVSGRTEQILAEHAGHHRGLLTIRNGIDIDRFHRRTAAAAGGGMVIGTVARLAPEKGLDRLVHAFGQLRTRHPALRLIIAGDGPERSKLQSLARSLGLESAIEFSGQVDDVERVLDRLDVFALPSLTEGIPLALLEAMAARLPVVATAVGGVPEVIVSGESGVLVPAENPLELQRALHDLIDNPHLRARLGAGAERRVRDLFSLEAMASRYRALYRQDTVRRRGGAALRRLAARVLPAALICWRGNTSRPEVSLTIDDGPDPEYTPQLLRVLKHAGVRATFFLVGSHAERHSGIVRDIVAQGHEVANHSLTHADFRCIGWSEARRETVTTRRLLEQLTPRSRGRLFRPPFGAMSLGSTLVQWLAGHSVVLWNRDFKDYLAADPFDVTDQVAATHFERGDIILYHGLNRASVDALPVLIEAVRRAGLDFVPVSQLCS